jgi:hypothetical protein
MNKGKAVKNKSPKCSRFNVFRHAPLHQHSIASIGPTAEANGPGIWPPAVGTARPQMLHRTLWTATGLPGHGVVLIGNEKMMRKCLFIIDEHYYQSIFAKM